MKRMRILFSIFILVTVAPAALWASEYFNCTGNLLVTGISEKGALPINSEKNNAFSLNRDKYLEFDLSFEEKNPLLRLYPWNGIHYKKINSVDTSKVKVDFVSGREDWFQVRAVKNGVTKTLDCQFFQF